MAVVNSTFSNFIDGGDIQPNDIVVGLRNGLNTRFLFTGGFGTFLPLAGGVMSGSIDMGGNIVFNSGAPTAGGDLCNKTYVDAQVSAASPLTTKGDLYTYSTLNTRLAVGTVDGQILQVSSAAATGLAWSTASYPVSTTINQLLFSSSANTVVGLATANSGVLITSSGGVPSISSTLPSAVQTNITVLGTQAQALNMGGHQINNGADPSLPNDFATKQYVDQNALNGTSVYAASAATLGTVTQSGAGIGATLTNAGTQATFALDGVNPPIGVNVLIKNNATGMTAANQGIYTVTNAGSNSTNWVLTRATSYDTTTEINETGLILIQNGSTLAGQAWYNSATIVTVDTTNFVYNQFGNIIFPISLANGGTGASLTASNGGIVYSSGSAMAILSGTATARQMLQSGASGAPAWSTSTWPATTTINRILFSTSNNTIGEISTVNSAVLTTTSGGVPTWVAYTGTNAPVLGTAPTISAPLINQINDQANNGTVMTFAGSASAVNYIQAVNSATGLPLGFQFTGTDSNISPIFATKGTGGFSFQNNLGGSGQVLLSLTGVASAVNYLQTLNSATGGVLSLSAIGSDSNISVNINSKGTGRVAIQGISTNTAAAAGYVGELLTAANLSGSPITFSTGTPKTLQTVTLTPGDWDVWGNIFCVATTVTTAQVAISIVNNTIPDNSLTTFDTGATSAIGLVAPTRTFSVSSNTPVYLVGNFTLTGTGSASGAIYARRRS